MGFVKRLIRVSAYLLYALLVLAVLLWYRFPGEAVRKRLESELTALTPGLQWSVAEVGLGLPADVRLADIEIRETGKGKEPLFRIDSISLRPDPLAYLQNRTLAAIYRLNVLQGSARGRLSIPEDRKSIRCDGTVAEVPVKGLKTILKQLNRTLSGTLSGSFVGSRPVVRTGLIELDGKFALSEGMVGFQEPVLGMEELPFGRVSAGFAYKQGILRFKDGKVESRLLAGEFSGTLEFAGSIALSALQVNGALMPRPELLAGIGDSIAVELLKKQLKDGRLPYTVNGTLQEPGIVFSGLPAGFGKQLQQGEK